MTIDLRSRTPLYYQLERELLAKMDNGEWKPGQLIPPEHEICATYGVSRTTARQALGNLVQQGMLVRKAGKGTFVREQKAMHTITMFRGLVDYLVEIGMRPSARVLDFQVKPAEPHLADMLRIPVGSPVLAMERLVLGGEAIMAVHRAYLPRQLVPGLRAEDFQIPAVTDVYLKHGLKVDHGLSTVEARLASSGESRLLQIPRRAVVMAVSRLSYLEDDTPYEFTVFVVRADMYTFQAETRLVPRKPRPNESAGDGRPARLLARTAGRE